MRRAISNLVLVSGLLLALLSLACAAYRVQHAPKKRAAAPPPAVPAPAPEATAPGTPVPPTGAVPAYTFARIQREILNPTCATAKCHNAQDQASGLSLADGASYAALVGAPAQERPEQLRVKAGDPDGSYLIQKLRGDPGIRGGRMPKDGPPYLTREQIEGVVAWVRAGAPAS